MQEREDINLAERLGPISYYFLHPPRNAVFHPLSNSPLNIWKEGISLMPTGAAGSVPTGFFLLCVCVASHLVFWGCHSLSPPLSWTELFFLPSLKAV